PSTSSPASSCSACFSGFRSSDIVVPPFSRSLCAPAVRVPPLDGVAPRNLPSPSSISQPILRCSGGIGKLGPPKRVVARLRGRLPEPGAPAPAARGGRLDPRGLDLFDRDRRLRLPRERREGGRARPLRPLVAGGRLRAVARALRRQV